MKTKLSRLNHSFVASLILIAAGFSGFAQELPVTVSPQNYESLKKQSPFLRELDPSETYAIRAVATIGDTHVATLYNRNTKKTLMIFPEEENEQGLKLVELSESDNPLAVTAKVSFAGEVFEVKYDQAQTVVETKSKSTSSKSGSKDGERKGPSKEDIDRYKSLSEEQRNKLRSYIQATAKKYPNISREERGNMIRGAMIRLSDGRDINVDAAPSSGGGGDRDRR